MPAAGAYPVGSTPDGRVRWSDGSVTGNMSSKTAGGYASNIRVPGTTVGANNIQSRGAGQVLGDTTGGGGSSSGSSSTVSSGVDFGSLLKQQRDLARDAYEEGVRRATSAFNRARGIYDEGMGVLGKRRDEFKTQFGEGQDKILDRYEEERGNLQASGQGAATRSANALRALGLGGSAVVRTQGRERQEQAQAFGGLQTQRNENDNANTGLYNDRLGWADTQESSLRRSLSDAEEARRAAESQSGLIERGDVQGINSQIGNYLSSILANQMALQASARDVSGYTANPYAVNLPTMTNALQSTVAPEAAGMISAGTPNQGASLQEDNTFLSLLKRMGVGGAGLYPGIS